MQTDYVGVISAVGGPATSIVDLNHQKRCISTCMGLFITYNISTQKGFAMAHYAYFINPHLPTNIPCLYLLSNLVVKETAGVIKPPKTQSSTTSNEWHENNGQQLVPEVQTADMCFSLIGPRQ